MSVNIHSTGDIADPEKAKSGEHRPPPIPADAMKKDGKTNRERLEASANALRSRLARTLESLDRRRHDALNLKVQASRHPLPLALAGAGAIAVAGGTALVVYHATKQPKSELHELSQRVRAVVKAWRQPHKAKSDKPSLMSEVTRGVVVSVASFAISQLAQNALVKYFPSLQKKDEPPK